MQYLRTNYKIIIVFSILVTGVLLWNIFHNNKKVEPPPVKQTQVTLIQGQILYGPTKPLGSLCSAPSQETIIQFKSTLGKSYQANTDTSGRYSIKLPLGTYTMIFPVSTTQQYIRRQQQTITVLSSAALIANGCWDTGIR